jgi:lipopolysaccharide/colanic/teichoic acid biosynthesis glycosyltransferase
VVLFVGDIIFFVLALWLSLYVRGLQVPTQKIFTEHLAPFSLLFLAWAVIFFVAGLYESRSIILARRALSASLLVAQVINIVIAALFFFFVPLFGIAPKVLLFIYLVVSFLLILAWRVFLFPLLGIQRPEPAIVVGEGAEIGALVEAMRGAHRAPVKIAEIVSPSSLALSRTIVAAMERHKARVVVADFSDTRVSDAFPQVYNLLSVGVRFFDALALYEEVFGRVPLSTLNERWLARNISRYMHGFYDGVKRTIDIVVALPIALVSLVIYPFVFAAIKLDDSGDVIISMPRVGEGGKHFNFYKFRSMSGNDKGEYGTNGATKLNVTRVGGFLRASRLDELPQLWNVLRGDLSLIGPRPEVPTLVDVYEKEIPYYGVRHLIKPGISGWAQLYHHADPHHATAVEDTKNKLSFDLYYLKHRSISLDLTIGLKTIRRILMRGNA